MKDFKSTFAYTNGEDFPNTKAVNSSGGTSTNGTELIDDTLNDLWGFMQASLSQSQAISGGDLPSGTLETATDSQILDGILSLTRKKALREGANVYTKAWTPLICIRKVVTVAANATTAIPLVEFDEAGFAYSDIRAKFKWQDGNDRRSVTVQGMNWSYDAGDTTENSLNIHFTSLDQTNHVQENPPTGTETVAMVITIYRHPDETLG